MVEWKEYILEDIVERFIDYRGKTPNKTSFGIPLITAKVVKKGKILEPNEFIAKEDYLTWMTRGFPEINDIVLTTEAPLGEIALLKEKNVALAQRIITLRTKKEKCFSPFLKYYFQNDEGQQLLHSRSTGTTVEGIKSAELKKIVVTLPPLPEQESIAEVLSSLDDKIDLLNQQNKTLEALAETLFKKWFVEEVESYTTLSYYVKVVAGYAFKSSDFKEEGNNRVIKITNIDFESVDVSKTQFINLEINTKLSKYVIPTGSFVIAMTGAEIGKIGMVPKSSKPLLLNQRVGLLVDNVPGGSIIGYLCLRSIDGQDFIVNEASGSAQPNISTTGIESMKVPQIEREQLQKLTAQLTSLYDKKLENLNQINHLETLRDTLLPKLMSGLVRVNQ